LEDVDVNTMIELQYFNGLHGIITQKIDLFITTAVRTSNHTL
jgi:hypothetical protein